LLEYPRKRSISRGLTFLKAAPAEHHERR
jgi:hypothetical protein